MDGLPPRSGFVQQIISADAKDAPLNSNDAVALRATASARAERSVPLSSGRSVLKNIPIDAQDEVRYNVQNLTRGASMQRLRIDRDIRSMTEFRTGIASFLKQVHDTKRPLIITQHGKGAAVLLDVGEYESMQEKLELLKDIQTSVSQIENGEGIAHENAKEMILNRVTK